ncbi:MAG: helicase, partial [bacterium]|nr:helicase [bacterium]
MTTSAQVRTQLIDALRLDLVGPCPAEPGHARYRDEILPIAPSKWYLTGFLVPYEAPVEQRSDDDGDDSLDQAGRPVEGDDDNAPEQTSARKAFFPSSMGLSVLVPEDAAQLQVKITWGDYAPDGREEDGSGEEAES